MARDDPYWAVLSDPNKKDNKWEKDEFYNAGIEEIKEVMFHLKSLKGLETSKVLREASQR